jgi:hypothetical protein
MCSRRLRRLELRINQPLKLNKLTKKHSLKGIKVSSTMMLGFNLIPEILKLLKVKNHLLKSLITK